MRKMVLLVFFLSLIQILSLPEFLLAQGLPNRSPNGSFGGVAGGRDGVVDIELKKPPLQGEIRLFLRRAVELALERSPALVVEKIRLEQERTKIVEQKGEFDPTVSFSSTAAERENVNASRFFPSGTYVEKERTQELGFKGKIFAGGKYESTFRFQELKSTSNTQTLSPQYGPTLSFNFSQPFLRDFGLDANLSRIRVAQKGEEIAEQDLALQLSGMIQKVVEAYWNLLFLRQDLEVKNVGLDFAKALLRQNEDLFRAGKVAQVSVQEARAGVAEREEAVIVAENEARKGEDQLKLLLYTGLEGVSLVHLDTLRDEPIDLDVRKSVELALLKRPEIVRLRRIVEQKKIEEKFASNQKLPRLDLTAQYNMVGLSGKPSSTPISPGGPSAGSLVAGSAFEDKTHPIDAFNKFFTRDGFDQWLVGIKLEFPLGNQTAKAKMTEATLSLMEAQSGLHRLEEETSVQVRNAIRDVLTARKRIEATRASMRLFEEQLGGTRKKFEAGIATSYEVLKVLDDLATAKTRELKALMDYNVGKTALNVAEGSVLEKFDVEIGKPPRYVFKNY
ncbi:MAG: TolC family protein [Candidatus Tectomicrobia bacterium]|uniref:TolC family protein n=1 Tax=Tectimicrobiota bacterium TaxID=2528274 RepID=A0A932LZL4_UNCTE|nr:TolC family protein [Candidatus Tectomicrobia bacterium]